MTQPAPHPSGSAWGTPHAPATIELRRVSQRFLTPGGRYHTALRDLSMDVRPGEFCAVVGPTGCGKSTTLSLISGLAAPSGGEVLVRGQRVTGIDPSIGFVFQHDAVFPWKSVLENVELGPRFRGLAAREAGDLARRWVSRVGLSGFERHYPHQLSGGMRKRVALAQTFINNPQILLMDEPFSALDVQTRLLMQGELLELWASSGAAVVFVTHDLDEAITLADRVYVLSSGPGTVRSVYPIDLPRPRVIQEIRYDPRFIELSRTIWADLRAEVEQGFRQDRVSGEPA